MKKLWFLVILIFIPLIFVGCFEKPKEQRNVAKIVLTSFNQLPNYESTLSYTKDGKDIVEKCICEQILGNDYYYYTYSINNEVKKEYWIEDKVVVLCYKKTCGLQV